MYKKTVQPYTTQCYERTAFKLSENSIEKIQKLIESDPVGDLESQNNTLRHSNLTFIFGNSHSKSKVTVPPTSNISEEFRLTRQNLPIFDHRDGILSIIEKHQVVVISGDTGNVNVDRLKWCLIIIISHVFRIRENYASATVHFRTMCVYK